MLRSELILAGLLLAGPSVTVPVAAAADEILAPTAVDTVASDQRDAWYLRGLSALFARRQPDADASQGADPQLARERFLPFAGWRIEKIHILGREAFGTVESASGATLSVVPQDSLVTRAGPFERLLNSLAVPTHAAVVRNFLLFQEGGIVVPAALADSERMLRRQSYIRDALIVVLPLHETTPAVDIVVLVRDRWPWGVQASIASAERQQVAVFHRNAGGLGLNFEAEFLHDSDRQPVDGWRTRLATDNLTGTFVDLSLETRRAWDRDQTRLSANRGFSYPDIRLVGGWSVVDETEKALPELPPELSLRRRSHDTWLGWSFRPGAADRYERRRLRLIPAVRWQQIDYREAPLAAAPTSRAWRDHQRYLAQLHLVSLDYYTSSLVNSYGETEDIPTGFWSALTGGYETGQLPDRLFHGVRVIWPRFLANARYLALDGSIGGFRRNGRFEDGVVDLGLSTFSPLQRHDHGAWRHFLDLRYTLGVNRSDPLGLRLDTAALRDLKDDRLRGNQRLIAELESVLFTTVAVSGFKVAAFGYTGVGLLAGPREPIFNQRLHANAGVGLRLNNPALVLPTIEMRLGALAGRDGWEPAVTLRMGEVKFVQRRLPGAQPALNPYR